MNRERALKVVLLMVGLVFTAGIYLALMSLLHPSPSDDPGFTMMLSLYVTLGILLLIAVRNPVEHRSLIAFAAWSSFAHATVMTVMGFENSSDRRGLWCASAVLVAIGVILIVLAPAKQTGRRAAAGVREPKPRIEAG